jgi:predicted transcriptional regulator YdeE
MDYFVLEKDIRVLYVTATSFPDGIKDAHENIHALVPFSKSRRYFGLSRPEGSSGIVYKAAAEELKPDEAELLGCETLVIKKGTYFCITIKDYMKDISSIGKAFGELLSQKDLDPEGFCVEWYVDNKEVWCMIRKKTKIAA